MKRRIALIMAGGGGSRLWPASTASRPKQLILGLPLAAQSLLRATLARIDGICAPQDIFIVTTDAQVRQLKAHLPEVPAKNFIVEPIGRNTAPCVALALLHMRERWSVDLDSATLLILPADHHIKDEVGFRTALRAACDRAELTSGVVTLGVEATHPATGYGYIERAATELPAENNAPPDASTVATYRALRFVEKPSEEVARTYLAAGNFLWNVGIFVVHAGRLAREFALHCPELWSPLERATLTNRPRGLESAYAALPSTPIDVALMEKQDDMVVIPIRVGWTDLGSWAAVASILDKDGRGNAVTTSAGESVILDSDDCLIWNDGGSVAVLGMRGVAVIHHASGVLVCPLDRAEEVRELVEHVEHLAQASADGPQGSPSK